MLNNIKTATRDSIIYGFGNLSIKLVGLVLIPVYTNADYISFKEFGMLGLLDTTATLLTAILGLSLTQGITRWYWDAQVRDKQKTIVYSIFALLLLIGASFLTVTYFLSEFFSRLLFSTTEYSGLVYSVIVASVIQVFLSMLQTMMKLQQKPILFTITNTLRLIFTLVLTIYFVVYSKQSIQGIYTAQIIGGIIFLVLCFKYIKNIIDFKFEKEVLKDIVFYSAPLIFASISGILLSFQDRYILNYYADLNKVGIYSLAYRIANTVKLLVVSSVQMAISPMLFQMIGEKNNMRFYSKYMTYFTFIVTGCTLVLNLFSYEIVKVFAHNTNYWSAVSLIPIISFSLLFDMLKDTSLTGLQIQKKTGHISLIMISIALFNLGLSFLLIPKWHYFGAAYATLVSEIIFFGVIYIYAQRHYHIPYELSKVFKMIIIVAVFSISTVVINDLSLLWRMLIKVSIVASFPIILYYLNFFEPVEIDRLKGAYLKWRNPLNWRNNIRG